MIDKKKIIFICDGVKNAPDILEGDFTEREMQMYRVACDRIAVAVENIRHVEIDITDEMEFAHAFCGEDSDCEGCPCCIGTDDCIYNHIANNDTVQPGLQSTT